jgi:hypothetical protein
MPGSSAGRRNPASLAFQQRADLDGPGEPGDRDAGRERDRLFEARRVVEVVPVKLASCLDGGSRGDLRLAVPYADRRRLTGGLELVAVQHARGLADRDELIGYLLLLPGGERTDHLVGAVEANLKQELHLISLCI